MRSMHDEAGVADALGHRPAAGHGRRLRGDDRMPAQRRLRLQTPHVRSDVRGPELAQSARQPQLAAGHSHAVSEARLGMRRRWIDAKQRARSGPRQQLPADGTQTRAVDGWVGVVAEEGQLMRVVDVLPVLTALLLLGGLDERIVQTESPHLAHGRHVHQHAAQQIGAVADHAQRVVWRADGQGQPNSSSCECCEAARE